MKNKKLLWRTGLIIVIIILLFYFFYLKPKLEASNIEYTYTTLEKGSIEASISSTGTLEAINTVQVGTQISGTISRIYVDYNDKVKQGQLLAEMDTKLLQASLRNTEANLAIVNAKLHQAEDDFKRNKALYERKVITEKEFKDSQYVYEQAISNKKAAEASVKTAQVNLAYAHINSPIAGTVTERSVEEGQTVAASFATPTLFIIAEDLSQMQILADVDESDIGYIHENMNVKFKVQTYQGREFLGKVSQIRLQPVKINNVVNYKVVVQVNNKSGMLLPGMTANLDFVSEFASYVLLINNSALRFQPDSKMLKEIKPILQTKAKLLPDSIQKTFLASLDNEEVISHGGFRKLFPSKINGLIYQTATNKLDIEFVQLGITTGLQSQISSFISGRQLPVGTKIINGIKSKEKK